MCREIAFLQPEYFVFIRKEEKEKDEAYIQLGLIFCLALKKNYELLINENNNKKATYEDFFLWRKRKQYDFMDLYYFFSKFTFFF